MVEESQLKELDNKSPTDKVDLVRRMNVITVTGLDIGLMSAESLLTDNQDRWETDVNLQDLQDKKRIG